jgi:hypothetical protein
MAVKRNRFVQVPGGTRSVNRTLEAKARALAGLKGYADVTVMPRTGWSFLVTRGCGAAASA